MKKLYIKIYATISLFFILGTVFWFLFGIINDAKQGAVDAKNTFSYFAKYTIKLAEKEKFGSASYNKILERLADEIGIKAFIISNFEKQVLISWSSDKNQKNEYIEFDANNNPSVKDSDFFAKTFSANIQFPSLDGGGRVFVITGSVSSLSPSAVFIRSRSAFFIILTIVILTLLIILFHSLPGSGEKIYAEVSEQKETIDDSP